MARIKPREVDLVAEKILKLMITKDLITLDNFIHELYLDKKKDIFVQILHNSSDYGFRSNEYRWLFNTYVYGKYERR